MSNDLTMTFLKLHDWVEEDKINWSWMSGNPNAIHLLEANPNKINWDQLSGNPSAIHLLEANPNKINWEVLSGNPSAIHILEKILTR